MCKRNTICGGVQYMPASMLLFWLRSLAYLPVSMIAAAFGRCNSNPSGICLSLLLILLLFSCENSKSIPSENARIALRSSVAAGGAWDLLGFHTGEKVPDFMLYSSDGEPFDLYEELGKGKPIVLVNGSYTCDFSRTNLPSIVNTAQKHNAEVEVVMVYTIDAHPSDTLSPYAVDDREWVPPNNIRDNISAPQPRTYGERVMLANQWIEESEIPVPVLIDGPDNEYWTKFGQAPNMCYIISPDGTVAFRETWYNDAELNEAIQHLSE